MVMSSHPPHSLTLEVRAHEQLSWFHLRFKLLLLLCGTVLVVHLYLSSQPESSWSYHSIFNISTQQDHRAPSYLVHPEVRARLEELENAPVWRYHEAYAPNYRFILDQPHACRTRTPFLVLMVPVAPAEVAARDAIRKTWGNQTIVLGEQIRTLFVVGLPGGPQAKMLQERLHHESRRYRDVIQSQFLDTYLNLTIKTMVIMNWLATRCPTAAYAMKVDSDMFLNIQNLVLMLQRLGFPRTGYLTGMLMRDRPVIRNKHSKWFVPTELYPEPTYPPYMLGMGYVFSNDLPARLVNVSMGIRPFNIEDAYVGMCMKVLGLSPTPPPNPWQFQAYNQVYNRCSFSKVITFILGRPQELLEYWADLHKPGPPCEDQNKTQGLEKEGGV